MIPAALSIAWRDSPFWRKRLGEKSKLSELPLLEKAELLADQEAHPPFGELLAVEMKDIIRVHWTSGTTGKPFLIALTYGDALITNKIAAKAFRSAGIKRGDVVVHCLNYSMWSGGVTDHLGFEEAGATVVPFGVGNTDGLIDLIRRLRPTVLSCTTSYPAVLESRLERMNVDPKSLGLETFFLGAEGGASDAGFKRAIFDTWGARAVNGNYGMADVLSVMGSECREENGLHFHAGDYVHVELMDYVNDEECPVPIEKGVIGEMVLTPFYKQAQPMFRLRTHDLIRIVDTGRCKCGESSFRFDVVGRTDNMVVVKGVNFYPEAIGRILSRHKELAPGIFQCEKTDDGITLYIECGNSYVDWDSWGARLMKEIRGELSVTVKPVFVEQIDRGPTGKVPLWRHS